MTVNEGGADDTAMDLSFDEFRQYLAGELRIAFTPPYEDQRFSEDLEFDSIDMLELLVAIEDLGIEVAAEDFDGVSTLRDAYRCYRDKVGPRT